MKSEVKMDRFINPEPWTIVSCRDNNCKDNALSIGLVANVSIEPEIIMIAVRKERYSYYIIKDRMEFVLNIAKATQKDLIDYFGTVSGRDEDKLEKYGTIDADIVDAPIIVDCPVNFECKVNDIVTQGSHDVFFARVVKAHCSEEYLNNDGSINWKKVNPIHSLI